MQIRETAVVLTAEDACLADSTFHNVNLSRAVFNDVKLEGATFENICLGGVTIRDGSLKDLSIAECDLQGMRIEGILVTDLLAAYRVAQSPAMPAAA